MTTREPTTDADPTRRGGRRRETQDKHAVLREIARLVSGPAMETPWRRRRRQRALRDALDRLAALDHARDDDRDDDDGDDGGERGDGGGAAAGPRS